MNVTFIGSGNLAWHLAPALDNTGYSIGEVYSIRRANAAALVKRLYSARVAETLDFSGSSSRVFIIAVTDDAIAEVAQEIILPDDSILVHTSGSQPLQVLEAASTFGLGVMYPLQTFTRSRKIDFNDVPFFIESSDDHTRKVLMAMAGGISKKVTGISSAERKALHVAAVFASNFTNHMLALSQDILAANKLDFEWMKPLVAETLNKSLTLGPAVAQTGPARRGDLEILDSHFDFLSGDEQVREIYRVISQNIVDRYEE